MKPQALLRPLPSAFILTIVLLFHCATWGENYYVTPTDHPDFALALKNPTSQKRLVYLVSRNSEGSRFERAIEVPSFSNLQIKTQTDFESEFANASWILVKTADELPLILEAGSAADGFARPSSQIGRWVSHSIPSNTSTALLTLASLGYQAAQLEIEFVDANGRTVHSQRDMLQEGQRRLFQIQLPMAAKTLRLRSTERIAGTLQTSQGLQFLSSYDHEKLLPPTGPTYFRVARKSGPQDQSFIVALDQPELIARARFLIQNPEHGWGRILIGYLALGEGGYNRDLSVSHQPPWSWHVRQVVRFADFASQECDGSPQFVEENLHFWMQSIGRICFWNYSIVEELSLP